MNHLYLDESGELGTSLGSSKFFVIAIAQADNPARLKQRMRKRKKALYDAGWPRDLEIKGTSLWNSHREARIPNAIADNRIDWLHRFIKASTEGGVKVHYSVIRKERLAARVLAAPYGIAYNFFSAKLVTRAHNIHFNGDINLIVDQRNKETHDKMTFDGYLKTQMIMECNYEHSMRISHLESHQVTGLQAVDFLSWGLFRYYEHNDNQFKATIQPAIGYVDRWYPGK